MPAKQKVDKEKALKELKTVKKQTKRLDKALTHGVVRVVLAGTLKRIIASNRLSWLGILKVTFPFRLTLATGVSVVYNFG